MAMDHVRFAGSGEDVPVAPPILAAASVWSPSPNVLIAATPDRVSVYRRDGDAFTLRGSVDLDPLTAERDGWGWSALS